MNLNQSIIHLFGGILAVNLVTFLRGIGTTIRGNFQASLYNID